MIVRWLFKCLISYEYSLDVSYRLLIEILVKLFYDILCLEVIR